MTRIRTRPKRLAVLVEVTSLSLAGLLTGCSTLLPPSASPVPSVSSSPVPVTSSPSPGPDGWPEYTDPTTGFTFQLPYEPTGYRFSAFKRSNLAQKGATYWTNYAIADEHISMDLTLTIYRNTGSQCTDGLTELEGLRRARQKEGMTKLQVDEVHTRRTKDQLITTGWLEYYDPEFHRWHAWYLESVPGASVGLLYAAEAHWSGALTQAQRISVEQVVSDVVTHTTIPASYLPFGACARTGAPAAPDAGGGSGSGGSGSAAT